jgi:hypothetical protein
VLAFARITYNQYIFKKIYILKKKKKKKKTDNDDLNWYPDLKT